MDAIASRLQGSADRVMAWVNGRPSATVNRMVGAAIAAPTLTVIGIATWLTPSPLGYGTHTQLGLGECAMLHMTGWPCPMCGMTTTFTLMAHLRPVDAFWTQPFGVILFSLTVIGALLGVADLVTGRGVWQKTLQWIGRREQLLAIGLLVGMIVGWLYKSARVHPEILSFLS